jgi:hypothetical protein
MMPHTEVRPELATDVALDQAIRPFIDRFIREDKRERATALLTTHTPRTEWRELISWVDTRRGRPLTDDSLLPWHTVRGVYLSGKDAFSVSTEEAMKLRSAEHTLFIAYGATFAVVHDHHGAPLLLT